MDLQPIDIVLHLVNIVVIYILLRMWVFKPVQAFMAGRQERVTQQMDEALALQTQASEKEKELTKQLASVKTTCDELMSESRQKGLDAAQKILDDAENKARDILDDTRKVAQAQRQQILDSTKIDLADLAITMAERVIKFDKDLLSQPVKEKAKTGNASCLLKTAMSCDEDTIKAMKNLMENLVCKNLELTIEVDESLIGGFAAYIDGQIYDFSYAAQLQSMKQALN